MSRRLLNEATQSSFSVWRRRQKLDLNAQQLKTLKYFFLVCEKTEIKFYERKKEKSPDCQKDMGVHV